MKAYRIIYKVWYELNKVNADEWNVKALTLDALLYWLFLCRSMDVLSIRLRSNNMHQETTNEDKK